VPSRPKPIWRPWRSPRSRSPAIRGRAVPVPCRGWRRSMEPIGIDHPPGDELAWGDIVRSLATTEPPAHRR
jgi:hypothetical protein